MDKNTIKYFLNTSLFKKGIYIHNTIIDIPEHIYQEIIPQIDTFSKVMGGTGQSHEYWYKNRGGSKDKMHEQDCIGKYGEFGIWYCLKSLGLSKKEFDIAIRKGPTKGWYVDVEGETLHFHIKTCYSGTISVKRYNEKSWVFQYSNKDSNGGKDFLFNHGTNNDIILFMYVDNLSSRKIELVASAPWIIIDKEDILKDPLVDSLIGVKKCVYFRDLKNNALSTDQQLVLGA